MMKYHSISEPRSRPKIVNIVMIVMNYPTDVNEYSYDTITY